MTDHQRTDHPAGASTPNTYHPRKPYTAPRMLSVEALEVVAGNCSQSSTLGKSVPQCNPQNLGS